MDIAVIAILLLTVSSLVLMKKNKEKNSDKED